MAIRCNCTGRIALEPKDIAKGGLQITIITPNEFKDSNGNYESSFIDIPVFGPYAQTLKNSLHKGDIVEANWTESIMKEPYIKENVDEKGVKIREIRPVVKKNDVHIWKHYSNKMTSKEKTSKDDTEEKSTQGTPTPEAKKIEPVKKDAPTATEATNTAPIADRRAEGEW